MEQILRIAIQKKGRLSDKSKSLMQDCGIDFGAGTAQLKARAYNFPAEFLFLRDDDIPGYVADGVADLGIVGKNVVDEKKQHVDLIEKLGFSKCRLSIAIPNSKDYTGIRDLEGKIIATSYPNILVAYLGQHRVKAKIHEISGSVEIAPAIGLTDAICDIVSTGSTLLSNGLKETEVIYRSEAVLISCPEMNDDKKMLIDKLLLRIRAVRRAKKHKYILLNAPNDSLETIKRILPGMKSPTVTPLALEGWSSLHSVVEEDDFWEIIEKLRNAGAEGILVVPIEKMIF
jgi:ATP phosphoribosyltransferase